MLLDAAVSPLGGDSYSNSGSTYISNGGMASEGLGKNWFNMRRPYLDRDGNLAVTLNRGRWTKQDSNGGERKPVLDHVLYRDLLNNGEMPPIQVSNATALRKEEWIELDRVLVRAARYRLRAYKDVEQSATFGGFNGMSKSVLERETMTDPGEALVDMDGLSEGRRDAPKFQQEGLPLPITHSDFWFSARVLAMSRNSSTPLDSVMGEAAARRCGESIEKTTIGNNTGITYDALTISTGYGRTSQVYGFLNFPTRITYTGLANPAGVGWTASQTLANVLTLRQLLYNNKFYGPFMIYHSNDWDTYMDNDYILTGGNVATQTLRDRLREIEGIQDVRRLDFMFSSGTDASHGGPGLEGVAAAGNPFTLIIVQMTPEVCRAVNGLDTTTIQWEVKGGMELHFKVMMIQVPQLFADFYGNTGILVATR
jgi:hypothetical protein